MASIAKNKTYAFVSSIFLGDPSYKIIYYAEAMVWYLKLRHFSTTMYHHSCYNRRFDLNKFLATLEEITFHIVMIFISSEPKLTRLSSSISSSSIGSAFTLISACNISAMERSSSSILLLSHSGSSLIWISVVSFSLETTESFEVVGSFEVCGFSVE